MKNKVIGVVGVLIVICVILFALTFASGLFGSFFASFAPTPTLAPTLRPTLAPVPTQANVLNPATGCPTGKPPTSWDVTNPLAAFSGYSPCITGLVFSIESLNSQTYIRFSEQSDALFILVTDTLSIPLKSGDCIVVAGEMQYTTDGVAYMGVAGDAVNYCP